jgi:hypothetical protein
MHGGRAWLGGGNREGLNRVPATASHVLYVASHTCTVQSMEPEAMRLPSGDHATPYTSRVCPLYL